jgi:hypothetical protein
LVSNTFAASLFLGGFTCYGTAYAVEASGNKYIAVVIGFFTQTGADEASGVDQSKADVWILNRQTGAIEFRHQLRRRSGRFLASVTIGGIGDVDSDADDELVAAWVQPFGDGEYKIFYETYNITNGSLEDSFSFFTSNKRVFD